MTNSYPRKNKLYLPYCWGSGGKRLQDVAEVFRVFASIIVAAKENLMLAAGFNATCGGILEKSDIIPLNVAVLEGLLPFGVLKLNFTTFHLQG